MPSGTPLPGCHPYSFRSPVQQSASPSYEPSLELALCTRPAAATGRSWARASRSSCGGCRRARSTRSSASTSGSTRGRRWTRHAGASTSERPPCLRPHLCVCACVHSSDRRTDGISWSNLPPKHAMRRPECWLSWPRATQVFCFRGLQTLLLRSSAWSIYTSHNSYSLHCSTFIGAGGAPLLPPYAPLLHIPIQRRRRSPHLPDHLHHRVHAHHLDAVEPPAAPAAAPGACGRRARW